MKVALVYDRVNKFGGAERVLQILREIWPKAPLFTSVYDKRGAKWADGWDIRPSFLQKIPLAKSNHRYLGWLMPKVFESMDLSGLDVVISVTSEAAKGIKTNKNQLHVCYLLTPTRYLWSHAMDYWKSIPKLARPAALLALSNLRMWDYRAAQKPDKIISISREVQKRCWKYYKRQSEVIYPGGGFGELGGPPAGGLGELGIKDYYLVVSRLVPYKKIDLAIETFNKLKKNLVIIGKGADEKRLKSLAGPMIKFADGLTDEELIGYYRKAKALVMPQEEDLGLTAIEAQSQGLPVVVCRRGGARELIVENKTGVVFGEQTVESLAEAIRKIEKINFNRKTILENAREYTKEKFIKNFKSKIEEIWNQK